MGLVLAGGESRRMGRDKGSLPAGQRSLAEEAYRLLGPFCAEIRVSINPAQESLDPYDRLPVVIDDPAVQGPAAGLLAAWHESPGAALLVLAVDMPLVDADLLADLISRRDPTRIATAYRHPAGVIEPLCAIWEPSAAAEFRQAAAATGAPSLRRFLESSEAAILVSPVPDRLVSVNTPAQFAAAQKAIKGG